MGFVRISSKHLSLTLILVKGFLLDNRRYFNTLFHTEDEKLQLLCYTKKSVFDDIECYAYVNLKTIGEYMTKDGYFTDFIDSGTGVWSFKLSDEVSDFGVAIINPKNKETCLTGVASIGKSTLVNPNFGVIDRGNSNVCRKNNSGRHSICRYFWLKPFLEF